MNIHSRDKNKWNLNPETISAYMLLILILLISFCSQWCQLLSCFDASSITRASTATVLITHPCISSSLWVKVILAIGNHKNTENKRSIKVINLTTLSSLVAPYVVVMTINGATSDDNVVKMTIFCLQWIFKQWTGAQYWFLTGTLHQYHITRWLQINFLNAIIARYQRILERT